MCRIGVTCASFRAKIAVVSGHLPAGKWRENWAAFALKGEHVTRIMSIGRKVPGQTAPGLGYQHGKLEIKTLANWNTRALQKSLLAACGGSQKGEKKFSGDTPVKGSSP
jgi:hypothetical protein